MGEQDSMGTPEHEKKLRAAYPSLYCAIWPDLVAKARENGYALMIHGSLSRDLDLVAVPWTEDAVHEVALVNVLMAVCSGWLGKTQGGEIATRKPHGRRAWTIMIGGHASIDLSVMPTRPPANVGPEGDRGLRYSQDLGGTYGGTVRLSDSSAATQTCFWLRATGKAQTTPRMDGQAEIAVHLTLETLRQLVADAEELINGAS